MDAAGDRTGLESADAPHHAWAEVHRGDQSHPRSPLSENSDRGAGTKRRPIGTLLTSHFRLSKAVGLSKGRRRSGRVRGAGATHAYLGARRLAAQVVESG